MSREQVKFMSRAELPDSTMLLALTGWMDGGRVSTGTLEGIMEGRPLEAYAQIDTDPYYLLNFPGSMELATMFRPEVRYNEGIVEQYRLPPDTFFCDRQAKLILFSGREPNLRWREFAENILQIASVAQAKRIVFMGSFGGTVPHTRQPRMFATVSQEHLKTILREHGIRFSNYHGPSSFATMLLWYCMNRGVEMISLVCEIPGYLQGENPPSIEAVTRQLAKMLNFPMDLAAMRKRSDEWESEISRLVEKDTKLAQTVRKLEQDYDNELIGISE